MKLKLMCAYFYIITSHSQLNCELSAASMRNGIKRENAFLTTHYMLHFAAQHPYILDEYSYNRLFRQVGSLTL